MKRTPETRLSAGTEFGAEVVLDVIVLLRSMMEFAYRGQPGLFEQQLAGAKHAIHAALALGQSAGPLHAAKQLFEAPDDGKMNRGQQAMLFIAAVDMLTHGEAEPRLPDPPATNP